MHRYRIGLYVEMEGPGATERDAAQRAADALTTRVVQGGVLRAANTVDGPAGDVTLIECEPLGDAARQGHITLHTRRP